MFVLVGVFWEIDGKMKVCIRNLLVEIERFVRENGKGVGRRSRESF